VSPKNILNNYGNHSNVAKLIALCVKGATGVIGGSLVLENAHPYLTLSVLAIGAIVNEIINFYHWNK
jgi:hypothetical protein